MRCRALLLTLLVCGIAVSGDPPKFVAQVEAAAVAGDFAAANRLLQVYRSSQGVTPEYIEALSWIGRGELSKRQLAAADENAAEVRKLCEAALAHRKLDAEAHLPTALGASIEVHALALGMQNRRDEAVLFLRGELKQWQGTSIVKRIQKNINLLTLEGKPVPALDVTHWIGTRRPEPMSAHLGHPVLLFLWAHWCPDCKAEVDVIARLMAIYGPRGLIVVAPTQHYGYVAGGQDASPAEENRYIADVFAKYYAPLGPVEVPLSEENFQRFGVSTTPTLVLVDRRGIVRLYNPGALSYPALAAQLETVAGN